MPSRDLSRASRDLSPASRYRSRQSRAQVDSGSPAIQPADVLGMLDALQSVLDRLSWSEEPSPLTFSATASLTAGAAPLERKSWWQALGRRRGTAAPPEVGTRDWDHQLQSDKHQIALLHVLQRLNQVMVIRIGYEMAFGEVPPAVKLVLDRFENFTLEQHLGVPLGEEFPGPGDADDHRITAFSLRREALDELLRAAAQLNSSSS